MNSKYCIYGNTSYRIGGGEYDDPELIKKIKDGMKQKMLEKFKKSVTQKDGKIDNCPRSPLTPAFKKL